MPRFLGFGKKKSTVQASVGTSEQRCLIEWHAKCERAQLSFQKYLDCIEPIERWYKQRTSSPKSRSNAINACERQIPVSREAMAAWMECGRINNEIVSGRDVKHPSESWGVACHTGFEKLAMIREQDCKHVEDIQLCQQAKHDGWKGDWDKRIARLQGKAARAEEI